MKGLIILMSQLNCIYFIIEKCRLPGLLSYPYGNIKNNRAYWKCNLGKSVSLCCPEGYLYRPYQGCVEFNGKTETCPPIVYHEGACDMRPVFGNATYYERIVHGNWIRMPCAPGTHYDPTECACSLFYPTYISNGMHFMYMYVFRQ